MPSEILDLLPLLILGALAALAVMRGRKRPWVRRDRRIQLDEQADIDRCYPQRAVWSPRRS